MICCFRPNIDFERLFLLGMEEEKVCSKCQEKKVLGSFYKRKGALDGHRGVCNTCMPKSVKKIKLKHCSKCNLELDSSTLDKLCFVCKEISKKENTLKGNQKQIINRKKKYTIEVEEERKNIINSDSKEEIWKDVPNFGSKYQASDLGRIRCMPVVYETPNGFFRRTKYYYVKSKNSRGYLQACLTDFDGNVHHKGAHRWVMYAFQGESDLQVDHINGIKDDNRLVNLRYATARENNNFRKDNIPEFFSSPLYGTYKQGNGWVSYIKINGVEHYLGKYSSDLEAHNLYMKAWREWDESGKLPEEYINFNKTSQTDGVDFHNASKKWRVRIKNVGLYVGIFETEALAIRVINIVNFLINKKVEISKEFIKKIRRKYTEDKRLRLLINVITKEIFYSLADASQSIGVPSNTLHSKLNKNSNNDTPIRYL